MAPSVAFRIATLIAGSVLAASQIAVAPAAIAAERNQVGGTSAVLLDSGTGRVLTLPGAATNVFVADSKVAEVRPASSTTLFVFGVGAGRTTVAAMDANGGLVSQFDVTVQTSGFGAAQAQAEIAKLVPHSHVSVRSLPTSLMLSGSVESPSDAAQAVAVAKAFTVEKQTVENQMTVRSSVQVTLQVRIVEISRSLSRKLGVNWQALGNIGQIGALPALIGNLNGAVNPIGAMLNPAKASFGANAILDALASEGMVRTLAEPT